MKVDVDMESIIQAQPIDEIATRTDKTGCNLEG